MEIVNALIERLNLNELEKIKIVKDISDKIGIKAGQLGLGVIAFLSLFIVFEYGTYWITFAIGFLYPAYMTFKAVESIENLQEDKLWLCYWVVFSILNVLDRFFNALFAIIPFYSFLKIGFIIWLFHPRTRGAMIVYEKLIKRFFKQYEHEIDEKLAKLKDKLDEASPFLADAANSLKKEVGDQVVKRVVS
jgi:Protein involved in membrane traffic